MNCDLRSRVLRLEAIEIDRGAVRYDVSSVPLDDAGEPVGLEPQGEMTQAEWQTVHCRAEQRY